LTLSDKQEWLWKISGKKVRKDDRAESILEEEFSIDISYSS
jgi:hypothetical protein